MPNMQNLVKKTEDLIKRYEDLKEENSFLKQELIKNKSQNELLKEEIRSLTDKLNQKELTSEEIVKKIERMLTS